MLTISNKSARRLIMQLQGLLRPPSDRLDADQLYDLIRTLGMVQVDSIRWVERAQDMILFSRCQHYRPNHLRELVENHRLLFESYTHDASVIPSEFFPYWRHRFARDRAKLRDGLIRWQGDGFLKHCDSVRRKIRNAGPMRSRDFKRVGNKDTSEMWQWHDEKAALEFLWRTGRLGIARRDGFQKVYDLVDRVIPSDHFSVRCSRAEFTDWACRTAIERLGFATPAQIAGFWKHLSISEVNAWLRRQNDQSICRVAVENADGTIATGMHARPDIESLVADTASVPSRVRVLSPFDPVIRNRDRLERLFSFRYRIEIYVPPGKREYGYYVFPLMERDALIGRIDMRADRANDTLEVKKLWLEPGYVLNDAREQRLAQELNRVAKFAGVKRVKWL